MIIRKSWVVVLSLFVVLGCSSTYLLGSWKNPKFIGKISKAYIIGLAKNDTARFLFEDEFSKQLAEAGVIGVSSYHDFPGKDKINKDAVKSSAKSKRADAVIVARVTGERIETVVTPGHTMYTPSAYSNSYGSYYSHSYQVMHTPSTVDEYEVRTIEANLYDTETEKLIWSAQMETYIDNNLDAIITDFVEQVIKDLDDNGLI